MLHRALVAVVTVIDCCLGYAFLLFQEESSVQALIEACLEEDGKLYLCVSSPTIKDKPVSPDTFTYCHDTVFIFFHLSLKSSDI